MTERETVDRSQDDPHENRVVGEIRQKARLQEGARKAVETRNERGTGNQAGNKIRKK